MKNSNSRLLVGRFLCLHLFHQTLDCGNRVRSYQTNKDALETMQRHWEWRWGLRVWINFPRLYLSLFWKLLSHLSRVRLCEPLWIVTCQVPLSTGFSSQALQSGLPRPPSEDLPNPGIKHTSPEALALQADSLPLSHQGSLGYSP